MRIAAHSSPVTYAGQQPARKPRRGSRRDRGPPLRPNKTAKVRAAWKAFSTAFREFPYDGAVLYNGPQQFGPANLLFASPTG
ncbi:MAG: hypothetical protein ABSH35_07720 [Isosphaeraceae bacterium]